jgi:hypothetical protein
MRRLRGDDKASESPSIRVVEIGELRLVPTLSGLTIDAESRSLCGIGAGSGLVSIALAALLARGGRHGVTLPRSKYDILTTDLGTSVDSGQFGISLPTDV